MGKFTNTTVTSAEIFATLIQRTALDASDKPVVRTALEAAHIKSDPLAPYADQQVKLVYLLGNIELPIGSLYLGSVARDKAAEFANNPKVKATVGIFCATTDTLILKVVPTAGGRQATVSTPRQTSPRAVAKVDNRVVLTEEEKAWLADYAAAVREDKELDAFYAKWHKDYAAAVKANEKFDQERAATLAKLIKATMRHPNPSSDAYNNFMLLCREIGATCKELNHEHNVRSGRTDANFGWKQIALKFEKDFGYRLIATGRQCTVAEKKGLSEAMRLIDRNEPIPANWVDISRFA